MASREHILDNKELEVSQQPSLEDRPDPPTTVSVRDFHIPTTSRDGLKNYFETPRSGGGEVTEVTIHTQKGRDHVAYVTFSDAQGTVFMLVLWYERPRYGVSCRYCGMNVQGTVFHVGIVV